MKTSDNINKFQESLDYKSAQPQNPPGTQLIYLDDLLLDVCKLYLNVFFHTRLPQFSHLFTLLLPFPGPPRLLLSGQGVKWQTVSTVFLQYNDHCEKRRSGYQTLHGLPLCQPPKLTTPLCHLQGQN